VLGRKGGREGGREGESFSVCDLLVMLRERGGKEGGVEESWKARTTTKEMMEREREGGREGGREGADLPVREVEGGGICADD